MIAIEYQGGESESDYLTIHAMHAALNQVPGIVASPPVVPLTARIPIGFGSERDLQLLGVLPEYIAMRNLVVLSGRFLMHRTSRHGTRSA
jgi:putative ABC transport system permease protein